MDLVAIGGTTRAGSSTELALQIAVNAAQAAGAAVRRFDGAYLARLPHFAPENPARTAEEIELVNAVRQARGLLIASPGYHGGVSGLVKNALDLLEDTARDARVYFHEMPVGLMVTAHGWQAGASTLASLRAIVHAMRGWPTPLGVAINSANGVFDREGRCLDSGVEQQLKTVANQVCGFVRRLQA